MDDSASKNAMICRLVVSPARRSEIAHSLTFVDSFDPLSIPFLQRWDKTRRAQGRPPGFEEVLEAYWVGFGFLQWLAGLSTFYHCEGCGNAVARKELEAHAEECLARKETRETQIPDPPEEIYMCPDDECGFWSTQYTDIRAPHRSKAHGGEHTSHSFILEDDPDVILDLWLKRHSTRILESYTCRVCGKKLSPGRALVEHFAERHATLLSPEDILGKILTGSGPAEKTQWKNLLCDVLEKENRSELTVVFSPSLQRIYRDHVVSSRGASVAFGSGETEKWIDRICDVVEDYFRAHDVSGSAVDVGKSREKFFAVRAAPGRPPAIAQISMYGAIKIRPRSLINRLSRNKN